MWSQPCPPALPAVGLPGSPVGGPQGQHRPRPPRGTDTQTPTGLHRETPVGHQGADAPHHRVPKTLAEPLRWNTPTLTPVPDPSLQGETTMPESAGQPKSAAQSVLPPGTAHSPGTCAIGPGSSFEGRLSSGPALHPSPPACSLGTQPREAPAEGRGPKLLTAGPIPYQFLNFYIRPFYPILTTQGTDLDPELGSHGQLAHGRP